MPFTSRDGDRRQRRTRWPPRSSLPDTATAAAIPPRDGAHRPWPGVIHPVGGRVAAITVVSGGVVVLWMYETPHDLTRMEYMHDLMRWHHPFVTGIEQLLAQARAGLRRLEPHQALDAVRH